MMIKDLGQIRILRKKIGMTQAELAEKVGVSQSLIAKIENGRTQPSFEKGRRILNVLEGFVDKGKNKRAKEVHSTDLLYLSPDDSVGTALEVMKENAVSQLPIIGNGKSIGSITERGLIKNFDTLDRDEPLSIIMDPSFPLIEKNAPISVVKELLRYYPSVLTMWEGDIVGIITKADLLDEV